VKIWRASFTLPSQCVTAAVWFLVASTHATAANLPPITAIAVTPDKAAVVVGSQAGVEVRAWPSLERLAALPTELANVHDLAFSPDGKTLAVVGGHPAIDGGVELYRWPEQELLHRATPHDDVVYAVAWRHDGKELALASADNRVSVIAVATEQAVRFLESHSRAVLAVAYLPNDGGLLSGGVDQSIRLWDVAKGTTQRTLANHTRAVNDLKQRPSANSESLPLVASAGEDCTVRFWLPTIGRLVRFARLESPPSALAWSDDGHVLWAACRDGRVRAIDPESAALVKDLHAINGVAYAVTIAPDENLIVAGSNGHLQRIVVRSR
jgi:WD40 repeat protein